MSEENKKVSRGKIAKSKSRAKSDPPLGEIGFRSWPGAKSDSAAERNRICSWICSSLLAEQIRTKSDFVSAVERPQ